MRKATTEDDLARSSDLVKKATARLDMVNRLLEKKEAAARDAMSKAERTLDTRRKILAGACVLNMGEQHPAEMAKLLAALDKFLTRPDDRKIFGLS